jgi:hypothetical protein
MKKFLSPLLLIQLSCALAVCAGSPKQRKYRYSEIDMHVVEVKFTKDGTPLNVTNPHLIVILVRNH